MEDFSNLTERNLDLKNVGYVYAKNFIRKLSSSISSHFNAIHSQNVWRSRKSQKNSVNPYFGGLKSFKVIDVDTNKKLVTVACFDKQHVCIYLQPFSRYTNQHR